MSIPTPSNGVPELDRIRPSAREWHQADLLLEQQLQLRSQLHDLMQSLPATGLYADEKIDCSDDNRRSNFAALVHHIQASLALSPRTILRHAVEASLASICESNPLLMSELHLVLGLPPSKPATDIFVFVNAFQNLPKGRKHAMWLKAVNTATKLSPWEIDSVGMRKRVQDGVRKKLTKNMTQEEIDATVDAAVNHAVAREEQKRQAAIQTTSRLELELKTDDEYNRYLRAHELWKQSGLAVLWESYRHADLSEGRERRTRGADFESNKRALFFAMIVRNLLQQGDSRCISDFWYLQGASWCNSAGNQVGEIDLVAMYKNEVVAICELKLNCTEIAIGFAQHESRLIEAKTHIDQITIRSGSEVLQLSDKVQLYIATVLSDHQVLGVEPALSRAICDGIRAQGGNVRDVNTTAAATSTTLDELLEKGLSRQLVSQNVQDYAPVHSSKALQQQKVDMLELETFVCKRLGPKRLSESPASCFSRCRDRVLVLKN